MVRHRAQLRALFEPGRDLRRHFAVFEARVNSLDGFATAQGMFERHRHTEAASALADVLSESPEFAPAHALLAQCQYALKQNLLARHHAEKAVELEPAEGRNHFIISQVLVRFFDWEIVPIWS